MDTCEAVAYPRTSLQSMGIYIGQSDEDSALMVSESGRQLGVRAVGSEARCTSKSMPASHVA
jgi:hypothetical protein